jgi:NAD+ synthase
MLSPHVLDINPATVAADIQATIRAQVLGTLKRRGAVVGLSGGIDSSAAAALCVGALGADRVVGLFMPERHSSGDSLDLGQLLARRLGITTITEDIAPALAGVGCYARQNEAIRMAVPEYGEGWRCKIVLPSILESDRLNVSLLTVENPDGERRTLRLPLQALLQLVAATNFKQRTRKMIEYYYADLLQYAVAGTPNRLEYDQGFFVKNGDGAADLKPIAHLYKSQVYQLAAYLGVPEEIQRRPPTTDTYPLEQTEEEFYFALPLEKMDLCLYGKNHGIPPADLASAARMGVEQVERVYRMIESRRKVTRYLRAAPLLVEQIEGD